MASVPFSSAVSPYLTPVLGITTIFPANINLCAAALDTNWYAMEHPFPVINFWLMRQRCTVRSFCIETCIHKGFTVIYLDALER